MRAAMSSSPSMARPVKEFDDLITYLVRHTEVGQTVDPDGPARWRETPVELTLEARPGEEAPQRETPPVSGNAWLGIRGKTLTAEMADAMSLDTDQQGVLVKQVEASTPRRRGRPARQLQAAGDRRSAGAGGRRRHHRH